MDHDRSSSRDRGTRASGPRSTALQAAAPGKTTLTAGLAPIQLRETSTGMSLDGGKAQEVAAHGVSGSPQALPHRDRIQALFGRHDVGGVQAHVGGGAATASAQLGASAYATGNSVAFAGAPDLHTAAHEAAHVVQQRAGVQLKGGVGEAGDRYEQHADAVADRVVAGESAEALLDQAAGASGAGQAVQRKEETSVGTAGAALTAGAEGGGDGVYGGVKRNVAVAKVWMVSNPSLYQKTIQHKLDKGEQVQVLDLGAGEKFNQVSETRYKWWKVKVTKGAHIGQEGWVMAVLLESRLDTKDTGTVGHTGKVGEGEVTVSTGQTVDLNGAAFGDNMFSMNYEGKDADKMRWLQFIWREVIGVDDKGASKPVDDSITTSGGTYQLTGGGTKDAFGSPKKENYNTDSNNSTDPFYEAGFVGDRTADSASMFDQPGGATAKAKQAFDDGAKTAVSRAHFSTFLVKDEKAVKYQTHVDIQWDFAKVEDTDAPPKGKHTVSNSGETSSLPATIAERFHDQFPGYKDLK